MFSRKPTETARPAWTRHGVAVGSVVLGWAAREALTPAVGQTALPFIFFFPAVAIAAWYGGFGPGALAALVSATAADWFFIEPLHSLAVGTSGDIAALAAFLVACSFIVGAMESMHRANAQLVTAREALREAHDQLAGHAVQLEKLVQERTAKLQEMVNELQHVSYAIAHDMRAPLRAMNTFASLLSQEAENSITPAERQEYSRRIIVAASRLDRLIQDALHYTKVAQQEMPLGPVDLSKLMRDLIETYPNLHSDKADIFIEGELPVVLGNDALLTQCFSNLLGNAVKFVAPGIKPEVRVYAERRDGAAKIWVKDKGIGIPKNAQPKLFGMFQRLDTQYEGTGIGLAIVRKVVERMGGKAGVESEPGAGSSFWVELPLANHQNKERTANT